MEGDNRTRGKEPTYGRYENEDGAAVDYARAVFKYMLNPYLPKRGRHTCSGAARICHEGAKLCQE